MAVTITTLVQPAQLSLDSFGDSAKKGDTVQVVHDGSLWKVGACSTAQAQRFGARPDIEVDTTSMFIAALGAAFPGGIRDAVVRELGLVPRPGAPLSSRLVLQAIDMAETSQKALQGVDFMTQFMFSAAAHSVAFVSACAALGLGPEAISPQQRAAVDVRMQERFARAAQQGQVPVAPAVAQEWLREELQTVSAPSSGSY